MVKVDCKKYADEILESVKIIPNKSRGLLVLYAGDNPASAAYMRGKEKDCKRCGIPFHSICCVDQRELISAIQWANYDSTIGGIIVQLPLPVGFDENEALDYIIPSKDVDGFKHNSPFKPCTPEGIVHIMHKEIGDNLSGKTALIIGRGKLVGKPLYELLQYHENMEVMQLNSYAKYIHAYTNDSPGGVMWDCIITATGEPNLLDVCKCNTNLIVDAGIAQGTGGKLCGDCFNFESLPYLEDVFEGFNPHITTVPGGVGLLTRAMLMKHLGEVQSE